MTETVTASQEAPLQPPEIFTGLCDLDELTGPLPPGKLTVLGGRPSAGTSALVTTIALHNALQGESVMVASLQSTTEDMYTAALAAAASVNADRPDLLNAGHRRRAREAADRLTKTDLSFFHDAARRPFTTALRSACEQEQASRRLGLLLVDNLALARHGEMQPGQALEELAALARDFDLPLLLTAHLHAPAHGQIPPTPQDFQDPHVAHAADAILLLHRPREQETARHRQETDILALTGWPASGVVRVGFEPHYHRFVDLPTDLDRPSARKLPAPGHTAPSRRLDAAPSKQPGHSTSVEEKKLSTPWPQLTSLIGFSSRVPVGLVAAAGTREARVGRDIAVHNAREGRHVLLCTSFPPAPGLFALHVEEEMLLTPEHVEAHLDDLADRGQPIELLVIERFERLRLTERPAGHNRAQDLEEACVGIRRETHSRGIPLLLTTTTPNPIDPHAPLLSAAPGDSSTAQLADTCRLVLALHRSSPQQVQVRIDHDSIRLDRTGDVRPLSWEPVTLNSTAAADRPEREMK